MAENEPTAGNADGAKAPVTDTTVDSIHVDTTNAIDAAAKPAPVAEAPDAAGAVATEETADKSKPQRLPKWAEDKLAETAFEAREATRRAKEAEEKLAAVTKAPAPEGPKPNAADDAAARANAPEGGYRTPADFDAAVQAEASRREAAARAAEAQSKFDAACNDAYSKGKDTFKDDFDVAVNNLRSVGAMTKDVLDVVLETADPAKVLYELGRDPEKAASLNAMTPARRAIEIARLSEPAPKKPVALSKAPTPVPALDGGARVAPTPTDDDDDDTFFAKREAELRESGRW